MSDSQFEQYWRRRFEHRARVRDDDAGIAGWSSSGLETRFRQFAWLWRKERMISAASGEWLDLGCGAGTYTRFLVSQNLGVTAVDYSELTTHKARQRSPGDARWAVADATCLPFANASVDGVLCFGVMQALSSPHRALKEIHRVLRPGGELWVDALNARCVPNAVSTAWRRLRGYPQHLRYDSASAFVEALRASGFEAVRAHWLPVMPHRLHSLQRIAESTVVKHLLTVPPAGALASLSFLVVARAGHSAA